MISGHSPKDFCSIFSETCCCVEQRGTAEEGWQRGDVPLSPPWDIFSTLSSFVHICSAMKHRDLQEWKLFEGGEEADRPPTREEMSSDMAGERMEDGQAYFTPVCSDHFVLLSIFVQELCLLWSIKSLLLCCSQTQQGVATWFAGLSWSCGVVQQPVVYFSNWFDLFVNICARNGVFCACFLDLLECCKLEYWVIPLQIFLTYTINISLRKLSSFTQILYILDPWISFTWL